MHTIENNYLFVFVRYKNTNVPVREFWHEPVRETSTKLFPVVYQTYMNLNELSKHTLQNSLYRKKDFLKLLVVC